MEKGQKEKSIRSNIQIIGVPERGTGKTVGRKSKKLEQLPQTEGAELRERAGFSPSTADEGKLHTKTHLTLGFQRKPKAAGAQGGEQASYESGTGFLNSVLNAEAMRHPQNCHTKKEDRIKVFSDMESF